MILPDPRIARYIAEVSKPGVPWISTSHIVLLGLYQEYGRDTIDKLLADYWEASRAT